MNNFLTAMGTRRHARSRDARPAQGARFATARRMSLRLALAFAALLFLAPLAIDQALGSNCEWSYRMNHSNSDCMHGWWDNSPPASTGYAMGSKYGVQSFCSNYGSVVAKIDISGGSDRTWTLNNGSKQRGGSVWNNVSGIYCCIDKGDMCVKQQVEKSNHEIKYFVSGNSTLQTANVNERIDRYNFCQDHPDTIYCDVNPQGDAHWTPVCGDHDCSVNDCNWHWNQNDDMSNCELLYMGFDDSNFHQPTCRIQATCTNYGTINRWNDITVKVWEVDDLIDCDHVDLKLSC